MPISTIHGWTGGGLLPSYSAVANALAGGTSFTPTPDNSSNSISPDGVSAPGASTPGGLTGTPLAKPTSNPAATAGLDPGVWARLGLTSQQRITQAYNNNKGKTLLNAAAGSNKAGVDPAVWANLGHTVRTRLLQAINAPAPVPASSSSTASTTNPYLFNPGTAPNGGWVSTGFG